MKRTSLFSGLEEKDTCKGTSTIKSVDIGVKMKRMSLSSRLEEKDTCKGTSTVKLADIEVKMKRPSLSCGGYPSVNRNSYRL